jgi:hypothetical protein
VKFADELLPLVLPVPDARETSLNPASKHVPTRNTDYASTVAYILRPRNAILWVVFAPLGENNPH